MSAPQIYLGQTPSTARHRRALRELALELHASLRQARAQEPSIVLVNFAAGNIPPIDAVDVLLIRPSALIVVAIRAFNGALHVLPEGRWTDAATGELVEEHGRTPLQTVRAQRDAVQATLAGQRDVGWHIPPDARILGVVACAPALHPDSRISLDVDDHRAGLKVLGLDELPALATMVQSGVRLSESGMRALASESFGGRLWHDGARLLFELAAPRYALRLLNGERAGQLLPLDEGESMIGRRRMPRRSEHRLALAGDDLVSSDHATLIYDDGDVVIVRDTSKNGTWVTLPGEAEIHLRGTELPIRTGTVLRLGATLMRLERLE